MLSIREERQSWVPRYGWRDRLRETERQSWEILCDLGDQPRQRLSDRATYILEDALEFLKTLPPSSLHAIVTDPSYGVEYEEKDHNKLRAGRGGIWRIPDLIVQGRYPLNSVRAGEHGVEIKSTRKRGGAVDTHGARDQWMAVFVYETDHVTEPAEQRRPMRFNEVYLGRVIVTDFRRNPRGELGTRTATLDRAGIQKLRTNWVYRLPAG